MLVIFRGLGKLFIYVGHHRLLPISVTFPIALLSICRVMFAIDGSAVVDDEQENVFPNVLMFVFITY